MVFKDRPLLAVTSSSNAEKMAQASYNKLGPWALVPFRGFSVTPHTLTNV